MIAQIQSVVIVKPADEVIGSLMSYKLKEYKLTPLAVPKINLWKFPSVQRRVAQNVYDPRFLRFIKDSAVSILCDIEDYYI